MLKKLSSKILLWLMIFFAILSQIYLLQYYMDQPMVISEPTVYELEKGTHAPALAFDLAKKNLFRHEFIRYYFLLYAYWTEDAYHLKAGEYALVPGITPRVLLSRMASGKILFRSITFVDGWTVKQILAELRDNPYVLHTLNGKSINQLPQLLHVSNPSLEGMFFPDTYKFARGTTDISLLRLAYQTMQRHLTEAWNQRDKKAPYRNIYQALIVASMVEKEAKYHDEQALIAGVILKRWLIGMRLQIDSTIIYGMGDHYQGQLTHEDIHRDSPYNSYTRFGLPPTPIGAVSASALYAALHPQMGDALFFVAKGDGHHEFTKDLKAHNRAVDRLIQHVKAANGIPPLPVLVPK